MLNKLKLNKRPKYEIPEDVLIGEYLRGKGGKIPNFEPDIIIVSWGRRIKLSLEKFSHVKQIWVKTDNEELKEFILNYDFNKVLYTTNNGSKNLTVNKLKEILNSEFYKGNRRNTHNEEIKAEYN